jgi:hypothetical protein
MSKKDDIIKRKNRMVKLLKNNTIEAVHSSDIETFLTSIDEVEHVKNHERSCFFCKSPISLRNIYSIFPSDGEVCYCCQKYCCVGALASYNGD